MNGLELCERVVASRPDVPVVVITAFGSLETAVARDPRRRLRLHHQAGRDRGAGARARARGAAPPRCATRCKRLRRGRRATPRGFGELIGDEPGDARGSTTCSTRVADTDASVLITGESGTGKELVARALHASSRRARRARSSPSTAPRCPEALLESELFGHVRGAFTDARGAAHAACSCRRTAARSSSTRSASCRSALQPKLLRALQERAVRPVGGDREVAVRRARRRRDQPRPRGARSRSGASARTSTSASTSSTSTLPPLRARGGDVLLLAQHFLDGAARARRQARRRASRRRPPSSCSAYGWPGNVRELQNCIERAVALARFEQIAVDDLPEKIRDYRALARRRRERRSVRAGAAGGGRAALHPARAARRSAATRRSPREILGLDRKTLYRKLERWGIDPA